MTSNPITTKPTRSNAPRQTRTALAAAVGLSASFIGLATLQPEQASARTVQLTSNQNQNQPQTAIWQTPCPEGRSEELWAFLDRYVHAQHRFSPMGVGPALGDETYNDRLSDNSAQATAEYYRWAKQTKALLEAIDRTDFTPQDHLDADLIHYSLSASIDAEPFKGWQTPVSSLGGPQVWLPQMGQRVPTTKDKHLTDYLARLKQVETQITDAMENMRAGMAEGRVPPRASVEPAVEQALSQSTPSIMEDPTTSPFFAPMRQLDPSDPRHTEAQRVIAEDIVPAYMEFAQFLQNEYIPACRATVGISDGIDGRAAYDLAIRQYTTLDLTSEDVHQIGLERVAQLKADMIQVIRETDWYAGVIGRIDPTPSWATQDDAQLFTNFIDYLRTDSRFYFDNPEDLLIGYRNISKLIDAEMPRLFGRLPRLPYGVREIPRFAAKASPTAYYYSGSVEGGVPGYFMANTYQLDARPKYDMVALTLHEGVPGHHHQIALAQELEGLHPARKLIGSTAFSEGWGLYSERLGLEVGQDTIDDGKDRGLYADPYDEFGRLNFEMWRAMRLVVDTGVHAMGWSRDQAIQYMLANSALTAVNVTNEVDRYIGWPGQATAYMIGQLKIMELRARAEQTLADNFDLRAFHDAVLENGSIPLPVLEAHIDRWIDEQQAAANN